MQQDARHEAVVRMLLDRQIEDRAAREKRLQGYRQALESGSSPAGGVAGSGPTGRLHRLRTRMPCRMTPEARALLSHLTKQYTGSTVTFPQVTARQQAIIVAGGAAAQPKQIGWIEHCVERDPELCNVRNQGISVETDGRMLIVQFRYPPTAVRMRARPTDEVTRPARAPDAAVRSGVIVRDAVRGSATDDDELEQLCDSADAVASVDFAEIRPALELPLPSAATSPPLVWVTRSEADTMDLLGSRDYEAFYVRFKLEVQAGIWAALSAVLAAAPPFHRHGGSYYTVVREADVPNGTIRQGTVDDSGRAADIGMDRDYEASAATDILLLHLEGDILADFADIYFTLQRLDAAQGAPLREEFFAAIRRFWTDTPSLAACYGTELPTVLRMACRAVPAPAQAPLLKQDWTNLRQTLVDRFGEGGRHAAGLMQHDTARRETRDRAATLPFAAFASGAVNVGLRVVYRQEWRRIGAQRGAVLRTETVLPERDDATDAPLLPVVWAERTEDGDAPAEIVAEPARATRLTDLVHDAAAATAAALRWPLDADASINAGVRPLCALTEMGIEAECRESSRDSGARLSETMLRTVTRLHRENVRPATSQDLPTSSWADSANAADPEAETHVHSRLQHHYEVLTRPAELQNIVLVAEQLPLPDEIDFRWVKRHDWILERVLLDESFRAALHSIRHEAQPPQAHAPAALLHGARDETVEQLNSFAGTAMVRAEGIQTAGEWKRGYRYRAEDQLERMQHARSADDARARLYDHIRANILHYQRAIWQQEDPQQRSLRYRASGRKLPLEWRFELEAADALAIEDFDERLNETHVDGHFAAYAAGRQAPLDEVIDPAGPIGYYGNYAIYHMRPEFGSEEMFAMLHFFKSPWLRPNAHSGEPEVADPAEMQLEDDPAAYAVSDRILEQQRDDMFRCVPALRAAAARARMLVRNGTDPDALAKLDRSPGALRRHYPTYLFRRERAHRIVLDTDTVVIDVIRSAAAVAAGETLAAVAPPAEDALILQSTSALMTVHAQHDAHAAWRVLPRTGERMLTLRNDTRAAAAGDGAAAAPLIRGGDTALTLRAAAAGPAPGAHTQLPAAAIAPLLLPAAAHAGADVAADIAARAAAPLLLGAGDAARAFVLARHAHTDAAELSVGAHVVSPHDAQHDAAHVAGSSAAHAARSIATHRASGGAVHDTRSVAAQPARGGAAVWESFDAHGKHADMARQQGIVTGGERTPALLAGATNTCAQQSQGEGVILATCDAGRTRGLHASAGAAAAPDAAARTALHGRAELSITAAGAAGAPRPHAILVADDDVEHTPRLVAGTGSGPVPHTTAVIVAGANVGLRPSLVAG